MKKKLLLAAYIFGCSFVPTFAAPNASTTPGNQTEAQIFTACSQSAIEIRDEAIGSARTAYNNSMAIALDLRKEAEKEAVALEDSNEKKSAIKSAVEEYKKGVTHAQEILTAARKEAWATFEANTKECRENNKLTKSNASTDKKGVITEKKAETKALHAESKSIRETIKDQLVSIKAFFKIGDDN